MNSCSLEQQIRELQEQLLAARGGQETEAASASAAAASAAAALAGSKQLQNELQEARSRVKYLESAVSGHVTRLEAQAAELAGINFCSIPEQPV